MTYPSARLLILGRSGQLARALVTAAQEHRGAVHSAGRREADLSRPGEAARLITAWRPDAVINAAAWTAVDDAETHEGKALRINAQGAGEAAQAAARMGARFIHVSTDYVFGAAPGAPYAEDAEPAPLSAYGRTKLAGERAVMDAHPHAAIVRAAGVFSGAGADFPSAMWRLAETRAEIGVVNDQLTGPTYAGDLAARLIALALNPDAHGIFHCASGPQLSWAAFAEACFDLAREAGLPSAHVNPIPTSQFPRPARRPADARLASTRLEAAAGLPAPDWRAGLGRALDVWRASR
ncbi:dTDP-4-dehydrorhamnose reductase [Alkalicaulis satelles]|uniref:dTDP-4-dehydrorhamnose reductase n=1 Tax=Alkalicaulis satelles TaxID=2609175 RepID=A0A5M6ZCF7_9PROT|nr:dTDP-4-dehydrorhamnose reductase [Alkalicaulis satelles]KAA5802412.1 dTDP-4-dehydrorhamnose reductase [Alkalicaulis satelles]